MTVPTRYNDVRRRILSGGSYADRDILLDHLWNIAFAEGRINGCEQMRDRLQLAFTAPLMEQSVDNLKAKQAAQEGI